ncbi:glycosyltransferase [Roseococcus sp. SDR]|uniref:glycosyltransferase n=1 Tax=Roseococcus sp. SDR TaxID=2835532 RepID=UPI001BCEFFDA|nr:glycosyltransferase [Roseococcus sp. SDR]MBS7788964.1 glycosyltransferase [Roseococcus sp. SDR]MBV1844278.1 glycosyltransferase [Roseococcus sp. SDR]
MSKDLPRSVSVSDADVSNDTAAALAALRASVDRSNAHIARLAAAVEAALQLLANRAETVQGRPNEGRTPSAPAIATVPAASDGAAKARSNKRAVNWIIGPADNAGWAYGNNAKRLAERLPNFEHSIAGSDPAAIAVYFDAIVAERYPAEARRSVLRIGGPRPLDRLFGDDVEAMRKGLKRFDAIVALNAELYLRVSRAHGNVHLIPNALDLEEWSPAKRVVGERPFTVGFAASLKSSAEAEIKGYPLVKAATERAGVQLLLASKGTHQIPHDRMIPDFYSKIDVLLQPVAPGREGTSNVIMEAISLGVPVITTPHAGYHSEFMVNGKSILIADRDEMMIAETISRLQRDDRFRRRIGAEARAFAERHHNIAQAAREYGEVFRSLFSQSRRATARRPKVAFVPFWEPPEKFGSSRLRAKYPSEFLAEGGRFDVVQGYHEDADIVIVVQMCDDVVMAKLRANPDQFLIYDVCDKYYENPRLFRHLDPPVSSIDRYAELIERANLVTVPSRELKAEVASRAPHRPVRYVPEPVDYGAVARPPRLNGKKVVLWFGNPDRGNFESARWMLDRLRRRFGYEPLVISRRSFFKAHPDYLPFCQDWSLEAMEAGFAEATLCVVAYDDAEQAKSPNRFIAAMMQGIPTLVSNSPACREILRATGHEVADIQGERGLDRAMAKLEADPFRHLYVRRVQRFIAATCGREATTQNYTTLIENHTYAPALFKERPRRVGFVSHNLSLGEGAPWSLFELASGLSSQGITPFVFAPGPGPLAQQYAKAGAALEIFDPYARHMVKSLNTRFAAMRDTVISFLKKHEIEALVCNTVKSAPMADFAASIGIPSMVIVRESYTAEERFSHFTGDARLAAIRGLTQASNVVFVAQTSRDTWADQAMRGQVHVIPNGISGDRFEGVAEMDKATARARLNLPAEGLIALCVGTVNLRKGQRELAQAFAELPAEVREACAIVFLGAVEGSGLNDFMREFTQLPEEVRRRLVVVDATEDVAPYYRAADMFLMNSSSEAYPRSVVEALYSSLPVLSTKVFGVNEQVTDGESGYLYDFNDMQTWKRRFVELVTDDARREAMAHQARRAFWKLTGHQEMLLAYKSILSRMIG